ncbi:MAG: hypothetical protein DI628_07250 [Blastochloris viridis]|uniref:Uncharacterized protein n=1 Tax=Blastochloris viridis TaxID=1079 RepID=A0A6N4R968_BLAVI|nr:MAG: hypothetical protein DI628_07250 [Blastochloris viridis]
MATPLLPLLEILRNPESPGFAEAAQRLGTVLETFDPTTLSEADRLAVQASLTEALANISAAQSLTAQELGITQKRAHALQSYNRLK